jgi:hypothetical protein
MDRAIFDLNASVEATSLYILLCALYDEGRAATLENARDRWNGGEENLFEAARELMKRGVIEEAHPLDEGTPLRITPRHEWR